MLPPHPTPVYFVVRGMRVEGANIMPRDDEDRRASEQFFYEESSCPTNWLKPTMVYVDGDSDPHGLLKFVASRDAGAFPEDEPHGPNDHDDAVVAFIESSARAADRG